MDKIKTDSKSLGDTEIIMDGLRDLVPGAFTEGRLDQDALLALLGNEFDEDNEKYQFTWKGKAASLQLAQKKSSATLRPDNDNSRNWDTTKNVYIAGDNLEVLKLMQKAYQRSIKMIYIDPPYNTGNDFVYKDDFRDPIAAYRAETNQAVRANPETAGRYHSNWLSMMYPRLKLAKTLLRDDGVIFISIDDNEIHNLRKICDEVFGEDNFVAQITREAIKGGSQSKHIRITHDYVLVYARSIEKLKFSGVEVEGITLNLTDEKGAYAKGRELNKWGAGSRREDSPSMYFPVKGPNGEDVYPIRNDGTDGRWRLGKEKMHKIVADGDVIFEKREDGTYIVYEKLRDDSNRQKQFISIFKDDYINAKGTEDIKKLFNIERSYFDYAKPVSLVKDLAIMASINDDDIVLDFFSGSGTTAQAVMQLNAEDGGQRKFIMVQLPEVLDETSEGFKAGFKNIADIGMERIRRAGDKINQGANVDTGFRAFRLDSSNLTKWDDNFTNMDAEQQGATLFDRMENSLTELKPGRRNIDIVYEVLLKNGVPLDEPLERIEIDGKNFYVLAGGTYLLCLDKDITVETIKKVLELHAPNVFIFADHCFSDDDDIANIEKTLERADGIKFRWI
jgi:adenine-specific DNA-methyltransferase